jgi:hypothetical protein
MDRNLPILIVSQFFMFAVQGIIYTALVMGSTMLAILRSLWQQSHLVATAYMSIAARGHMDSSLERWMYWFIRILSFILMFACIKVSVDILWFLVRWILHWT